MTVRDNGAALGGGAVRLWGLVLGLVLTAAAPLGALAVNSAAIQLISDVPQWTAGIYTASGASLTYPVAPALASTSHWDVSVSAAVSGGLGATVYAASAGTVLSPPTASGAGLGASIQGSLQFGAYLQVDVQYTIVNNPQTGTGADTVEMKYVLRNVGPGAVQASLRLMIDTEVNGVDGANISLDNGFSVVPTASVFRRPGGIPASWWDYDVPPPGLANVVGRGSLYANPFGDPATQPSAFEVAQWSGVQQPNAWSLCPPTMISDSSTVLWWTGGADETAPGFTLAPGAAVTLVTYYGLNRGVLAATFTPVRTPTSSPTISPTATVTPTATATATPTPTVTVTPTPSITPTPSVTPTLTASATASPTATPTASFTVSPTSSATPTISPTFTITCTFTPSPVALTLQPHSPNPDPATGSQVWLPYTLSVDARISVRVFDVAGEALRHWDAGWRSAGSHEEPWDLANDTGRPVASGVFLCRIRADTARGEEVQVWERCAVVR